MFINIFIFTTSNQYLILLHVRYLTILPRLILLLTLLTTSFTVRAQNSGRWSELASEFEKVKKIKLFYDESSLEKLNELAKLLGNNPEQDVFLKKLEDQGLSVIIFSTNQWVIAAKKDTKTSLAVWQERERLVQQQAEIERQKTVINIGSSGEASSASLVTVSGKIQDKLNGIPVIGATVEYIGGSNGSATDADGSYSILVPKGSHQLVFKSLGMVNRVVDVMVYSPGKLDIEMEEEAINLEEVVVTERAKDDNIKRVQMGVEQLALKEIKKLPSFMGEVDVVKSLLSLPGVSTAGEGVGGLNIRGGNTDQNLIIQDDIMFFNSSHALGFFSLFHPDLVEGVKLYKGNIPTKYGGRISSVLQTTSITGDKTKWTVKGGVGLTASKIAVDGPIIKDKLTISAGYRVSTINYLFDFVNVPEVQASKVNFYDLQGKLTYWINEQSAIGIQAYDANDDFRLGDQVQFDYTTRAYSAYYKSLLGGNKLLNIRLTKGQYESNLNDLLPANSTRFNTGVNYTSARADISMEKSRNNSLNFGIEAISYDLNPGAIYPGADNSEVEQRELGNEKGIEMGVFGEASRPISEKLTVSAGLRFSGFGILGQRDIRTYESENYYPLASMTGVNTLSKGELGPKYFGLEPRLSANLELSPSSSFKASINRTFQYLAQISNSVAASPIDYWKLSDNNIKPQSALTYSLGYYKNFKNNVWETSAEIYYRDITNANDYIDFADLLANEFVERELIFGKGINYGLELSAKKTIGKVTTRLGYTYSRSLKKMEFENDQYTLNEGKWYPSNFDKPHDLQLLLNVSPSRRYSYNFNYNIGSGRPVSAPAGKYNDWNAIGIPIYGERNNYRLPLYHRMDFSANIFPGYRKDKRMKSSWTFGVYNVYFRKNAYSLRFRQENAGGTIRAFRLAVLGSAFPAITYNFTI